MFDDLASLFVDNVIAAYDSYCARCESDTSGRHRHLRGAIEAATALYHFREHLPVEHALTRNEVETACPDYRLVADVVNAAKHKDLTRNASLLDSAEDIEELTVITEYEDEEGRYTDARTIVIVNCQDGSRRNLDAALTNVLNYWGQKLRDQGVIQYSPRLLPEMPGTRMVTRADAKNPNLEALQGFRFKKHLQLLRYDPALGCSNPIDLTGADVQWRIYKPVRSIDLVFTLGDGDQQIPYSLALTEEQSWTLHRISTDEERKAYINQLLVERRAEVQHKVTEALRTRSSGGPPSESSET